MIGFALIAGCQSDSDTNLGSQINDFESCVNAGFPVIETYPEKCMTDSGELFVKNYSGEFCGGFGGILCPEGYECKLDGDYPDAGGICVSK